MKPWLEVKRDQAFPDPAKFKTVEEFSYAALASSALKKAIVEILMLVEQYEESFKTLQDKKSGEVKNKFKIGE